ncbi:dihydrolipoyllysine-residue succinyltransferase [Buchnera aphidicola (Thelaxes californica)]|uniref:Dihydrolipoyllysine-residue succinyltransferase n=1 Tax=Buchnera aphidicola (Thelaxes californica) TaxID=1315998 RepID=A0A4D6Y9S3_9GAMM|nr:dihydrolipoyllysine-residue succinyltransferase [Buchnera aphidicola]QCI26766.1 dihydrolipoyllysine-residue succinyltransferase [Buchnera aphidicola (Thelaxes californica)]
MSKKIEIYSPVLPESVINATVSTWYKKVGDKIKYNDILLDLETDKVILEIPAPQDGILYKIIKPAGATVVSKDILGLLNVETNTIHDVALIRHQKHKKIENNQVLTLSITPSARRLINTYDISIKNLRKICKDKKITSAIVEKYIRNQLNSKQNISFKNCNQINIPQQNLKNDKKTQRIPMSPMRQSICERLLQSKNSTVMLTTFQEINMQHIIQLREKYQNDFQEKNLVKLGFMSFYVKAITECLKQFPEINASIEGKDIIYYKYFDISIAVSTKKGLITPILKNTDNLSMSEIEKKIKSFVIKANEGKLKIEELIGGNFTISNGGVFGSLFSTPIINPPQSAILGIHTIKKRPVVINNMIKIMPMMYAALTYDHRIVDGKEAISFLKMFKNILEDYSRISLNI